jgi:chromosome partitioning protein
MNYMALIGTRQVVETLKTVSQIPDHKLRLSLIVPTFYFERYRKDREVMETLQRHFSGKVADPIRANVKLAEAPSYQMSIYEYAAHSSGAIDYARLVERVVNNGASSKAS